MSRSFAFVAVSLLAICAASDAAACNAATGQRTQYVDLDWNGENVKRWSVMSDQPTAVKLPNGFALGVSISDASAEKYEELRKLGDFVPELVRITLYDMSIQPPRRLTHTWGGANSKQGYGARGGADRVVELGDPGISMWLSKPVCVPPAVAAEDQDA